MPAWPPVFCFISVPEWQNGSLLQEMLDSQKRTSCFYGSLKREVGFKKKRKNKIWINIFQLVSQSRKHVQTLFHRFLAVEVPPGRTHSSSQAMKGCWTPGELRPLALPRALAGFRAFPKGMAGSLRPAAAWVWGGRAQMEWTISRNSRALSWCAAWVFPGAARAGFGCEWSAFGAYLFISNHF